MWKLLRADEANAIALGVANYTRSRPMSLVRCFSDHTRVDLPWKVRVTCWRAEQI